MSTRAAALSLYRRLLVLAKKLPDPVVVSFTRARIRESFSNHRFELSTKRIVGFLSDARAAASRISSAIEGEADAYKPLVESAYGARGPLKHKLKQVPNAPRRLTPQQWLKAKQSGTTSRLYPPLQELHDGFRVVGDKYTILLPFPLPSELYKSLVDALKASPRSRRKAYAGILSMELHKLPLRADVDLSDSADAIVIKQKAKAENASGA